jgi:hypothetical protein
VSIQDVSTTVNVVTLCSTHYVVDPILKGHSKPSDYGYPPGPAHEANYTDTKPELHLGISKRLNYTGILQSDASYTYATEIHMFSPMEHLLVRRGTSQSENCHNDNR